MSTINRLFDITGKIAIVTGGSRGIGNMIARGFVENGVKTYITSRTEKECQAAAKEMSRYGQCVAIPGDLSSLEGVNKFVEAFNCHEENLDILINNAGIVEGEPIENLSETKWDNVMNTNLKSLFFLTQRLLETLKKGASIDVPARILNIASVVGVTVPEEDGMYAYASSKAGVIHLTRLLAKRLARSHITVNAISPAMFPNRRTADLLDDRNSPLGRIGTQEDVAGVATFLSSRAGAWITGANIPVDGGFSLR